MATGDRLDDSEKAIQQRRTEKWIVNEVVPDAIDVGVHHQRINESQTEHDPKRCVREKEEEREEIREVEKTGQRRHDIPACVRKNFRIGSGAFDIQRINVHLVAQVKVGALVLIADVAGERKFRRDAQKKNGRPLSGTAVTLIKQPENSSGNGSATAADF